MLRTYNVLSKMGLTTGLEGELVFFPQYSKGWSKIPLKYRTKPNYETFCYMNYVCMDAEAMFLMKIKQIEEGYLNKL